MKEFKRIIISDKHGNMLSKQDIINNFNENYPFYFVFEVTIIDNSISHTESQKFKLKIDEFLEINLMKKLELIREIVLKKIEMKKSKINILYSTINKLNIEYNNKE